MNKSIFEQKNLIDFFQKIYLLGRTVPFSAVPENEHVFIIRHDIDLDLAPALNMAKLEYDSGIISTFFIMVSNQSYNILSEKSRQIINDISDMGFEVGLHFDPTIYRNVSKDGLLEKVKFEASIIENITGEKIHSISLHKPSIYNDFFLFENYINAYDSRFFSDDVYMSDSSMNFRGKDPFAFIEKVKEKTLQILLHPIHYGIKIPGYPDILKSTARRYISNIDSEFRAMNPFYKDTVDENIIDRIMPR